MKKQIIALGIAALFTGSASAIIPVTDMASIAQTATQWTEKLAQFQQTVQYYQNTIQTQKNQLAATTGVRQIGGFVNQLQSVKSEMQSIYTKGNSFISDYVNNPEGSLSSEADSIFNKYQAFGECSTGSEQSIRLCKAKIVSTAAQVEMADSINDQISDASKDFADLSTRLENATDSKESQDLANTMQAKSAQMQALQVQMQNVAMRQQAQKERIVELQHAQFRESQQSYDGPNF